MTPSMPINIPRPQSDLLMIQENAHDENDLREDVLRSCSYPPTLCYTAPRFYSPPTQKPYPAKIMRKCAYIIAAVHSDLFISSGALLISPGVYILPRTYNGSSTGETCAVVGISKRYIRDLFDRNSAVCQVLKTCSQLKNVPGIEDLGPYKLNALKYMLKFLYFVSDQELILFNIEPKGSAAYEYRYPCANICLPGGGMEFQDEYSWFRTACREFEEEVGLILPPQGENLKLITQQRFSFPDRQAQYFFYHVKKFISPNNTV